LAGAVFCGLDDWTWRFARDANVSFWEIAGQVTGIRLANSPRGTATGDWRSRSESREPAASNPKPTTTNDRFADAY
jgi:hypothetical protein